MSSTESREYIYPFLGLWENIFLLGDGSMYLLGDG